MKFSPTGQINTRTHRKAKDKNRLTKGTLKPTRVHCDWVHPHTCHTYTHTITVMINFLKTRINR